MTLWDLYQWAILKEINFFTLIYICEDISLMVRFEKFKNWHTAEGKPHILMTLALP